MEEQNSNQRKWEWLGGKLHIHEPLSVSEAFELSRHLQKTLINKADTCSSNLTRQGRIKRKI